MSFELPKGLPKLSDVTKVLATPEAQLEKMGLPPGPQSMLLKLQKSFEAGGAPEFPELPNPKIDQVLNSLPKLPTLELPELPELPKLPGMGGASTPKGEVAGELQEQIQLEVKKGVHGEAI